MPTAYQYQDFIADATRRAYPKETGGVLLGEFDSGEPIVWAAVEAVDPEATESLYEITPERANAAIRSGGEDLLNLKWLGVWHSHPNGTPASTEDLEILRETAEEVDGPVLVAIAHPSGSIIFYQQSSNGTPWTSWTES